jgi:hypothetical protein
MNSFLVPENTLYPFCSITSKGDKLVLSDALKIRECCSDYCKKKLNYCTEKCKANDCNFKCSELYRICESGCSEIDSSTNIEQKYEAKKDPKNNENSKSDFSIMLLLIFFIFLSVCILFIEK